MTLRLSSSTSRLSGMKQVGRCPGHRDDRDIAIPAGAGPVGGQRVGP
jgi:hypothetical protein